MGDKGDVPDTGRGEVSGAAGDTGAGIGAGIGAGAGDGQGAGIGAGDMVIVAYRPKPGQDAALARIVREHVPKLRAWGFATGRPSLIMRAADGTLVEVFEWGHGQVAAAHQDARVLAMWGEFGAACDIVTLRDLAETQEMFATFVPVAAV